MANRLSTIATRTGDDGTTGLGDGSRVPKSDVRIHALGEVDELNSALGMLLTEPLPTPVREDLLAIQHDLFDLGGELSIPGHTALQDARLTSLDAAVTRYNADLPRLAEFILPGGTRAAAQAHLARTVCRRAERAVAALLAANGARTICLQYLNRLSDLLFVLARVINRAANEPDVLWDRNRQGPAAG